MIKKGCLLEVGKTDKPEMWLLWNVDRIILSDFTSFQLNRKTVWCKLLLNHPSNKSDSLIGADFIYLAHMLSYSKLVSWQ